MTFSAQPGILQLLELHKLAPEVFGKMEIYLDGGITRGTDIVKALALGATAVGVGRPYLYSLAYGSEGVEHITESSSISALLVTAPLLTCVVLKDELTVSMKLCGATDVDQLGPHLLNTKAIESLIVDSEEHPWIKWKPRSLL